MLLLLVAHPAEARILIDHYRLHKLATEHCFAVYHDHDRRLALTVSGQGKTAAAAATMNLKHTIAATSADAWLNIGIAGHGKRDIGDALLVSKVVDADSGRSWYPQCTFTNTLSRDTCLTVSQPRAIYEPCLLDMEASGFYETASRITTLELIHSLKVISDNPQHPWQQLDRRQAANLIAAIVPVIGEVVESLVNISDELHQLYAYRERLPQFIEHWHFTQTQRHTLDLLLRRWSCLKPGVDPFDQFMPAPSARILLDAMRRELDEVDVELDGKPA